ncbi:hypothetical protein IB227_02260 [Stenotrophomonas sp. STM01]|uniref:hypothetical protein n=1 Tax=Stenotrophomonas sp. STM01 TaxID=2769278 RepID=UPI0017871D22|nr:hypothetical protein [Stenotrophomonas sp. STM01]MBD9534673.1 hypothetical protein [Stenotrophomonas sp. STM01]
MQDARIATGLSSHPKTKKLIRALGQGGAWNLICLITWAAANRSDGDLSGMTVEDIELAADWLGEDGAFVRELVRVRFLDQDGDDYALHDWADHNPWAAGAEARSEKSKWAALCKQYGRPEAARMMPEYAKRIGIDCQPVPAAPPESASGMPLAESGSANDCHAECQKVPVADSGSAPSPSPSPSPSPEEPKSSLRSDSSSAAPDDASGGGASPKEVLRLAAVTDEAIAAWNASALVKGNGGLLAAVNPAVGRDKRQQQVKRCVSIARDICLAKGHSRIPPEFWAEYFAVAARDDFHSGRQGGGRGHENWMPDFEFMTQPKTMLKLFEREEAA